MQNGPDQTNRMVRLYLSERGIWHYEVERDGIVKWSSLHTRDEGEARRKYDRMQRAYTEASWLSARAGG